MKILHLMMNEKFTKGVAAYYDSYLNNGQHEIGYVHPVKEDSLIDPGLAIPQYDFFTEGANPVACALKFKKLLKEYDHIVLHSIFVLGRFSSLLYLLSKSEMKKLVWIEWGSDLYDSCTGLKKMLRDRVKRSVGAFVAVFPPDQDVYRRLYPQSKAKVFFARYLGRTKEMNISYTDQIWEAPRLKTTVENKEPVYVLIGHNGQEQLNHLDVLKRLEAYKDEDIRVVLSLSYGGAPEYVESVASEAKRIFGEKAIIMKDFMARDEYFRLMERIDIAVFDTARQTGLSNLNKLLCHKVKLYMRSGGMMYGYFVENGFPIQDCAVIGVQDFQEFSAPAAYDYGDNSKALDYFVYLSDSDRITEDWMRIYRGLRE